MLSLYLSLLDSAQDRVKFERWIDVLKKRILGCLMLVLSICIAIGFIFRYRSMEDVLSCGMSDVDGFQIMNLTEGTTSPMMSVDDSECLETLFSLKVSYRPSIANGIRHERGESVYDLVLFQRTEEAYEVLGTVTLAPDGRVYIQDARYAVEEQSEAAIALLSRICFDSSKEAS